MSTTSPVPQPPTGASLGLIAAVARGGVIGKDGGLPWHLPEDLRHFRRETMGHALIMGRRTWESIGRALPGRTSIVVSSRELALPDEVHLVRSLGDAVALAQGFDPAPLAIGGGAIYAAAMPLANRLLVTELDLDVVGGDAFFPPIPPVFREVSRRPGETPGVTFVEYRR